MTPTREPDHSDELVFRPVPTSEDMLALSQEARQAKTGRARLLIVVVFLVGMVAAGAIGMAMVKQNAAAAIEKAEVDVTRLTRLLADKEAQSLAQQKIIDTQKAQLDAYAPFQSIVTLQQQSDQLETEIKQLLAEPSRVAAPGKLTEIPPDVEWLDTTISALTARRNKLQQMKAAVAAWPPAPTSPRPD
ncbi:MAG: hypothetical protein ACO33A_06155 [Hyphomonas sp.]